MIRSLLVLTFAALLIVPVALAGDKPLPQGAGHVISVHADAAAAATAAAAGDTVWYTYVQPPIPQIPCAGEVTYTYYLLNLATGARHSPITKSFGGSIGFRSDGPTNGALARALGDGTLVDVELRLDVRCTQPAGPAMSVLIATIGVTP